MEIDLELIQMLKLAVKDIKMVMIKCISYNETVK